MAHFLVVDDEAPLRDIIILALESAGHTATGAANGREALELFARRPPDVLITDILMPDRDGIEVILELRRDQPYVPVIAISGTSPYADLYLKMAQQLGARRILRKPFTRDELLAAVADVLGT